ncbi:ABC transporter ATP-binding protein [Nitrospira tepida]|uniref:ABC transporter ATP-binding protein n=1 Tax=Nitrospira tepida TaxID=2973512 RepID=A0AA86TED8_9BACT|nr:ABC transporter ATP-binding protein [Nitrospira tepida]CAI4033184.1 ABC transporter ATP-binding protein [Nitrospira tepida]
MDAITVEGLTKTYGSGWPWCPPIVALANLSLSVPQGEIFGFLGPNGAGKTTTLKILLGLMRTTSGKATVLGKPAGDVQTRAKIGFLPEAPYFYDYLTAEEFLGFYGQLAGLSRSSIHRRVTELIELVGLCEARTRQLCKFSKGMLQRVGLAQALIHDPELVILDEPMSGLDPVGRKHVRDVILGLRERGKTIFFSSHIIADVEVMCDRVGIVVKGRMLTSGRIDELVNHQNTQSVEIGFRNVRVDDLPVTRERATRVLQQRGQCLVVLPNADLVEETLAEIRKQGGKLVSVTPQKGSLEELFMRQAVEDRLVVCAESRAA